MRLYAQVAVDVRHPDAKNEYTYLIPEGLILDVKIGDLVQVPFNNTRISGVVTQVLSSDEGHRGYKIKSIIKREPINLSKEMVELSELLADYYGAARIDFLKLMLPPKGNIKLETIYSALPGDYRLSERAYLQRQVFDVLLEHGNVSASQISKRLSSATSSISYALTALIKKGYVSKTQKVVRRRPLALTVDIDSKPCCLTSEQETAMAQIAQNIGKPKTVLLYGVTGSGKTEIYIRTIEKILKKGKKAMLLVPEISLTPQMVAIFQNRFPGEVAVIHSRLSTGERFDEWSRIDGDEAKVVIGPRSAVFAPVRELGIIIIDEEHESSYKQMEFPFYDARTVARMRADQHGAMLILGSATPSVDTYYKATKGEYMMVKLTKRVSSRPLPRMEIVDMTEEMRSGHRQIFSRKLLRALETTIASGQQAILFLNRRGHSTFVICRDCGFILKCPHCDISLTYHFDEKVGKCHYCGYAVKAPDTCPQCQSRYIRYFGAGTEKIEQEARRCFPGVKTLRIDSDTTSRKGSLEHMLSSFRRGKAQILIGTQVVAKGLDFPNVTLVGIISADTTLNMPDFRAGERTFQLITQVAGRAGRGELPGKVYIQTYTPEALAIKAACEKDIDGFYSEELQLRRRTSYPPFCSILNIIFTGSEEDVTIAQAQRILELLSLEKYYVKIYGPVPAPRPKIRDNYRYNILIKSQRIETLTAIARFLKTIKKDSRVNMAWDVDPQDML